MSAPEMMFSVVLEPRKICLLWVIPKILLYITGYIYYRAYYGLYPDVEKKHFGV